MKPEDLEQSPGPKLSDIAEKAADRRGRLFDPTGRIESLTGEETLIFDVRRHSFGLFLIYAEIIIALTISVGLIIAFLPSLGDVFDISRSSLSAVGAGLFVFASVFAVIYLILATRIYKGNQLICSDKNVTQVLQTGLFHRKVSELSMGSIEDVTARQQGILPTLFNYGLLSIETAGEQNNFHFKYCPNPNAYAKAILDARQEYILAHGRRH